MQVKQVGTDRFWVVGPQVDAVVTIQKKKEGEAVLIDPDVTYAFSPSYIMEITGKGSRSFFSEIKAAVEDFLSLTAVF
jgi:hypothetical protein